MRNGLTSRCASIRIVEIPVLDIEKDPSATIKALTYASKTATKEDGAEVICLGCAGMTELDKPMEQELGVPVLDGVVCAVKMAEAAFDYGLKLSKIKAFKKPGPKEFVGFERFRIVS